MGGKRVADLSVKLLGIIATAFGSIILLMLGVLINGMVDMRSMVYEMYGALPHFEKRISRLERLYEQKR